MKICSRCQLPYWFVSETPGVCIGCVNLTREEIEFRKLRQSIYDSGTYFSNVPNKLSTDVLQPEVMEAEKIIKNHERRTNG